MEIKQHLIALDLDGTLLTKEKTISTYTKNILMQAKRQGHIIVIATGRSHLMSGYYYNMLQLDTPMINYNGSYIHHPTDQSWGPAIHHPVPKKIALQIVDACYEHDVKNLWVESNNKIVLDQYDPEIIKAFERLHQSKDTLPLEIGHVKKHITEDPTALIIYPNQEIITPIQTVLSDHFSKKVHHRIWGAPYSFIEINRKGISKAYGLQKLSDYYNIPQDRIIAFGDEDNDLEMIDYAGMGVAMENGIDELKAIADHITESNDADGVGTFLADYLKIEAEVI